MKFFHELKDTDMNLDDAIARHSADKCVTYKTVHEEPISLGYYFPKDYNKEKKYPTFLFIHGGGWTSHNILAGQSQWQGDHLGYLARYYADKGFIGVSIDYRLARNIGQEKDYGLIECYEDCCDAIDYVLNHADEYGTDTENMYLLGESAGGHLAGAVATFHYDRCYTFKRTFLINAITDLHDMVWTKMVPRDSEHVHLAALDYAERVKFLSPLYQVDEHVGEIVLIHGNADACVFLEHSNCFYSRMCELSKSCELHIIDQTNHAFLLAEYTKEMEACRLAIRIIDDSIA